MIQRGRGGRDCGGSGGWGEGQTDSFTPVDMQTFVQLLCSLLTVCRVFNTEGNNGSFYKNLEGVGEDLQVSNIWGGGGMTQQGVVTHVIKLHGRFGNCLQIIQINKRNNQSALSSARSL